MKQQKRIVILFSRLSDYMINTLTKNVEATDNVIEVYKKEPINSEAPFRFDLDNSNIIFKNENGFNTDELLGEVKAFKPDLIICSGWSNKKYLSIVKHLHKRVPCILTMDNQWQGSIKQYLGLIYSRIYLRPLFHKIWIPGHAQVGFAKKLGFSKKDIIKGWYVANDKFYNALDHKCFNKRFVFVGRYVAIKGIIDLIESFVELKNVTSSDWQLHCYGTGELAGKLPLHNDIIHHGFLQPQDLAEDAKRGGVFVSPSHFEPWGLVIQEFALAGYPLLVSNKVGAAQQFVKQDNGLIFKSKSKASLTSAMKTFVSKSDNALIAMSKKSQHYAKEINSSQWNESLNNIFNNFKH